MENYVSKKSASIIFMAFLLPFIVLEVDAQYAAPPPIGISGLSSQFLLSLLMGLPRDPPVCNFGCPAYGQVPTPRPDHVPNYNGCGSYGFERLLVPEMDLFVDCCNVHDLCYDSCGANKMECDFAFQSCLLQRCTSLFQNNALPISLAGNCMSTAQLLGTAPVTAGCNSFIIAQTNSCACVY